MSDEVSYEEGQDGWHDPAAEQREHYKELVRKNALPEPNSEPGVLPDPFDKVSLCAKGGGCKHYFRLVHPIAMKAFNSDGSPRPAFHVTRRCLIGAVKLEADPVGVGALRPGRGSAEAPYGVVECSHYFPLTDEEIAERDVRRLRAEEREREKASLQRTLDTADEEPRPVESEGEAEEDIPIPFLDEV